jgi:hypothetical protein
MKINFFSLGHKKSRPMGGFLISGWLFSSQTGLPVIS